MFLEYHEVYWVIKISGIIEDIKTAPRNKWRKAEKVNLDTSSILASIETKWWTLILAWFLSIYQAMQIENSQTRFSAHDDLDC